MTGENALVIGLLFAVVLVISILKGGFGGGFSVLGVPFLSLAIDPVRAAAILVPIVCFMDLFAIVAYPPRTWHRRNLYILVPALLVGLGIGTLMIRRVDAHHVQFVVGVIAVVFAARGLLQRKQPAEPRPPSVVLGGFWGCVSGFTTFIAHSGGPPLAAYLLPQRLPPAIFAGTATVFFLIGNYLKIGPYIWLGQLDLDAFYFSLFAVPAVPLGIYIGKYLNGKVAPERLYLACYVLLILVGVKLLADWAMHVFFAG